MSQPSSNIFSLEQARQTLPLIRPIVDDVRSCHKSIKKQLGDQFTQTENKPVTREQRDPQPTNRTVKTYRQNLTEYVNELYQIGAELHDFNVGRVDFPSRLEDRVVYLCWETGEDDIQHWHELYEPCHKRRKIKDQEFDVSE